MVVGYPIAWALPGGGKWVVAECPICGGRHEHLLVGAAPRLSRMAMLLRFRCGEGEYVLRERCSAYERGYREGYAACYVEVLSSEC